MKWRCKYCDEVFESKDDYEFESETEEELWGHIQLTHEDVFEEVQDLDTPYMLEECYERK